MKVVVYRSPRLLSGLLRALFHIRREPELPWPPPPQRGLFILIYLSSSCFRTSSIRAKSLKYSIR